MVRATKRSITQQVLLLVYLALFLNLGPSFHRADIFGLHHHAADVAAACDCGLTHGLPVRTDEESFQRAGCDDCAWCRFFDDYQVTIDAETELSVQTPLYLLADLRLSLVIESTISQNARGPPIA